MDKCKREKDKLYEFACNSEENYYALKEFDIKSYFIKRKDHDYMREYGFETLPELKKELELLWGQDVLMQKCMQTVLIAAMKLKPTEQPDIKDGLSQQTKGKHKEKLSPFIYNF